MTKLGVLLAVATSCLAIGTAAADGVDDWDEVSSGDLGETRGGTAVAVGGQDAHQEFSTGGSADGGDQTAIGSFNGQSFVINAFNSGNNVVMQNNMAVDVCLNCTINAAPDIDINP